MAPMRPHKLLAAASPTPVGADEHGSAMRTLYAEQDRYKIRAPSPTGSGALILPIDQVFYLICINDTKIITIFESQLAKWQNKQSDAKE